MLIFSILSFAQRGFSTDTFSLPVQMPNLDSSPYEEMYLCTAAKIPTDSDSYYVVEFDPAATEENTHHMLLYACETPGMESTDGKQAVWACGHDPAQGQLYKDAPTCAAGKSELMYAWARNAKKISLPDEVGFHVGKAAGTKYIVVQVHYKHMKTANDNSGVILKMTTTEQPKTAGVIIMGHMGSIPAKSTTYLETSCQLPEGKNVVLHPIGFRTHSHNLGVVISGYKVEEDKETWTLIGKMDPRKPQTFYPIQTEGLTIKSGDYIAARCTMVSDRDRTTYMGSTNQDEMCNYYVMYYVDPADSSPYDPMSLTGCWTGDPNSWSKIFKNIPDDASTFENHRYDPTGI